jgi:hypothetical protein
MICKILSETKDHQHAKNSPQAIYLYLRKQDVQTKKILRRLARSSTRHL